MIYGLLLNTIKPTYYSFLVIFKLSINYPTKAIYLAKFGEPILPDASNTSRISRAELSELF